MPLVSINPANGRQYRSHRAHSPAQIDHLLARVHAAQPAWSTLTVNQRVRHLRALASRLRSERDDLADLIVKEMGKPVSEARSEIEKCAKACDYYARHAARFLRPEKPPDAPPGAEVVCEPLGVVLAIMPWNFPFWQAFRAAIPALMAGNTLLLKHASNVCGCALAIEGVCRRAGLPANLLRTILVGSDSIPALIADDRIRGVTLTGSTAAGRKVGALAGAALKPCVLELGGSDPYLVLADADLAHAAKVCATSRLINGGQSCIAAKRFLVVKSVYAEFARLLVHEFSQRRQGPPDHPTTTIGPMAREDLRRELHGQVRKSLRAGATLLLGGDLPKGPGFYYPPTVLGKVRPGMPAFDEELFGPVAAIVPVKDEREAITLANATPYGLGAAVFTRNHHRGHAIATRQLAAGMVFVNDFVRSDPALPFGGIKDSGFGRELGRPGIHAFVNLKTVVATP